MTRRRGSDRGARALPRPFGDYHLLSELGRGGMGAVYLAKRLGFREDIQRYCVVKTMLAERTATDSYRARFADEARIVVTLNHRNICHVFDVGVVDDEHYLAMELIEGVSLRELWQRQMDGELTVSPALGVYIVEEVLEALDYAHRHSDPATGASLQIVHRDVSPHNVMISFEGEVKLIDFGLVESSVKAEHTASDVVVGKLFYMSPEQARGEDVDVRTDVYATAIMAVELLTGERFYGDLTRARVMLELTEGTRVAPGLSRLPASLRAVLDRALAPEREDRTATCGEFAADLREAAAKEGYRAGPRDLRELMITPLADERAELREQLRSFAQIGSGEVPSPHEPTRVVHLATAEGAGISPDADTAQSPAGRRTRKNGLLVSHDDDTRVSPSKMPATRVDRSAPGSADTVVSRRSRDTAETADAGNTAEASSTMPMASPVVATVTAQTPLAEPIEPTLPSPPAPGRRSPVLLVVATSAIVGVLTASAVWFLATRRTEPDVVAEAPTAAPPAPAPVVEPPPPAEEPPPVEEPPAPEEVAPAEEPAVDEPAAVVEEPEPKVVAKRTRKRRRVRAKPTAAPPPDTPLRDLGDHFAYLEKHCRTRAPSCTRQVLAQRRRLPLLDAAGIRSLTDRAARCVAECRR